MFIGFILTMPENAASPAPTESGAKTLSRVNSVGSGPDPGDEFAGFCSDRGGVDRDGGDVGVPQHGGDRGEWDASDDGGDTVAVPQSSRTRLSGATAEFRCRASVVSRIN